MIKTIKTHLSEPLASKIRPITLDEFIGQQHLVGPEKPLCVAIEKNHIFSFILWGPPGVGKTTLARIYAQAMNASFYEFSAVSAGKEDIKSVIKNNDTQIKVLFLDEIHRFTKAQQDFLLPYVESGELVLIGATTENPSFEVIPALLSRCRVFVLKELSANEMKQIIQRTNLEIDEESMDWIISMANGDARQALNVIENTYTLYKKITVENLQSTIQNSFLRYDKKSEEHYYKIDACKPTRCSIILFSAHGRSWRRSKIYCATHGHFCIRGYWIS
jgi:putative ATPase